MTRQSPLDPGPAKSDAEADPVAALMQMLEALPDQDTAPKSEPEPVNSQIDLRDATPPDSPSPDTRTSEPRRARGNRVKTTFLGFEPSRPVSDEVANDPDEQDIPVAMFPGGWLVIVSGPGRGAGLPVFAGVSQIGRGDDQTVQLNFGDAGISRSRHAVVAYDPETRQFYLGHGGKSNIVRRNGMPVLATEPLGDGDEIRISDTTLRFCPLCGPDFCWSESE